MIPTRQRPAFPSRQRRLRNGSRFQELKSRFKNLSDCHAKAGQMWLGRQLLVDVELLGFQARAMDFHRAKDGIDYPYQRNSNVEILLNFFRNFLMLIRGGQNLNGNCREAIDELGLWRRTGRKFRGDIGDIDSYCGIGVSANSKTDLATINLAPWFGLLS